VTSDEMRDIVKEVVTIPKYFYEIIMPELQGYFTHHVDFDIKPWAQCPLHDEDTPSFKFFEETNSYYCFGCRSGGDIITLHREFMEKTKGQHVTYKEATTFLYKYFVEDLYVDIPKLKRKNIITSENQELSTSIEISRFMKYLRDLEGYLLKEKSIDLNKKIIIYDTIDNMELLVSLNKLNATEGLNIIKQIVSSNS